MIQIDVGVGGRLPSLTRLLIPRPNARLMRRVALVQKCSQRCKACLMVQHSKRSKTAMATTSGPVTDVLHSENHSKLSAEEIAKAVERHNKKHPAAKAENAAKTNKAAKK